MGFLKFVTYMTAWVAFSWMWFLAVFVLGILFFVGCSAFFVAV